MAAERRRQKEILRRRAMRRYYAFLALLGALALAALVGLFFLIKAAAGWARGGQASSVSAAQSVSASAPPASSGEPAADMPAFVRECLARKLALVPGNAFMVDEEAPCGSFRMNFSTPTPENIVKGVSVMAGVLAAQGL